MPSSHYPDIAAARHLKTAPGPTSTPVATGDSPASGNPVKPAPREDPARRGNPVRATAERSTEYRRQRLIALSLAVLTFLAVPTLVILLVLFG
ncbi:hypothetical protein N2K95_10480 [Arthrobacter zhaoxinii]|uniref:ABC transporter permease n=1 Tax=Arthrobacter zhaoxinii TaxID=2964616 RepID=A0ABY5YQW7_9MICC|nr:hypothetical protein [Arthrobacter zhaoxinii]UWX96105.1 hypothetical protein N2K95_10480 [Arthrobacter zhaoxinii]